MNTIHSLRSQLPTRLRAAPLLMMGHREAVSATGSLALVAGAWAVRVVMDRPIRRAIRRRLAIVLGAAVIVGAGAPVLAQPASASAAQASSQALDDPFDDAMQAYERNHWPQAFEAFRQLAEQGHVDAARLVTQMHWQGTRLYRQQFSLTPSQIQRFCQQSRLPNCPA